MAGETRGREPSELVIPDMIPEDEGQARRSSARRAPGTVVGPPVHYGERPPRCRNGILRVRGG